MIHFDYGLDEGRKGETTVVALLDYYLYQNLWNDFQKETSPLESVDEVKISGKY